MATKKTQALAKAERFFYVNAGSSYMPGKETAEEGKRRGAKALAKAERQALTKGFSFRWSIDPGASSADWIDDDEDGGRNCNPWQVWQCAMYNRDGRIVESLHGIDFGRDGEPYGDNYRRVVEAEIAIEGLTNTPQSNADAYLRRG